MAAQDARIRNDPDAPRYVIRWFRLEERDGRLIYVALPKFVILNEATDDREAQARFERWAREEANPFANSPDIVGPLLFKTERIA